MSEETVKAFVKIQAEGLRLFARKNADYGDSFREDGVLGVAIRMKDKLNRFINLARKDGEAAVPEEALRETFLDFHNYSAMAVIALDNGEAVEVKKIVCLSVEYPFTLNEADVQCLIEKINDSAAAYVKLVPRSPAAVRAPKSTDKEEKF